MACKDDGVIVDRPAESPAVAGASPGIGRKVRTSLFGAAAKPWRFFHKQHDRYRQTTLRESAILS
jgi:hypothetical protein